MAKPCFVCPGITCWPPPGSFTAEVLQTSIFTTVATWNYRMVEVPLVAACLSAKLVRPHLPPSRSDNFSMPSVLIWCILAANCISGCATVSAKEQAQVIYVFGESESSFTGISSICLGTVVQYEQEQKYQYLSFVPPRLYNPDTNVSKLHQLLLI